MVMRPGNLGGGHRMVARSQRNRKKSSFGFLSNGIGNFGKGYMAPPPGPPPGGAPPGAKVIKDAYNKKTGQHYFQDPKCPEGERMLTCDKTTHQPVAGCGPVSECCDIIMGPPFCVQDCDPPSPTGECDDDPDYAELPSGEWPSCEDVKKDPRWRGIPGPLVEDFCTREDLPDKRPAAPKPVATAPGPPASKSGPAPSGDDAETAKLAAELEQLEEEHSQVSQMVTQGPTMPLPSSYTGGGMPAPLPRRARKSAPTDEDKLAALVSEHETRKAMQRASVPPPMPVRAAPAPVRAAPAPVRAAPAPAPRKKRDIGSMFNWLRAALFGPTTSFDGLGESSQSTNILIPLIVGLGILFVLKNKS